MMNWCLIPEEAGGVILRVRAYLGEYDEAGVISDALLFL
jgi:hypothetical protein